MHPQVCRFPEATGIAGDILIADNTDGSRQIAELLGAVSMPFYGAALSGGIEAALAAGVLSSSC